MEYISSVIINTIYFANRCHKRYIHIYIYLVLYSTRNALIYIVIYVIKAGKPMRFLKIPEYSSLFSGNCVSQFYIT